MSIFIGSYCLYLVSLTIESVEVNFAKQLVKMALKVLNAVPSDVYMYLCRQNVYVVDYE